MFVQRELSFSTPNVVGIHGNSANYGMKFGINISAGVFQGGDVGVSGSVQETWSVPEKTVPAYGYMRSADALNNPSGVMDYFYEKDASYSLKDNFLPIAFSNADVFAQIGGDPFRLYNRGLSSFRQNAVSSTIDVDNFEVKFTIGAGWGIGARWGDGSIEYVAGGWDPSLFLGDQQFSNDGDEPWFFRSTSDYGGGLLYDSDDNSVRANIIDSDKPALAGDVRLHAENWERPGRNNYIGYTLNADMLLTKNGKPLKTYNKDSATLAFVEDRDAMPEQIGEFATFGDGAGRTVYGLPAYARDEKTLTLGLPNITLNNPSDVKNNSLAYQWTDETVAPTVIGEESSEPYATAWLITETTTPDYVDLTADGPTDDDLGGWTKFHYYRVTSTGKKASAQANGWTLWRNPYTGLAYNAGGLSDPTDDLGTFSEGKRETYYLERIETKTHVAVFHLNDYLTNTRKDGYSLFNGSDRQQFAGDSTASTAFYLQNDEPFPNVARRYLESIELFTKDSEGNPDSLLATVRFEYDYSLRPNMPNSLPLHPDSTTRFGLLTLKRVWVER